MTFEQVMKRVRPVSSNAALQDDEAQLLFECVSEVPMHGIAIEVGAQLGRSSVLISQLAHDKGFHSIHIDPHTRQEEYASGWIKNMKSSLPEDHRFTALYMRTAQADWLLNLLPPLDFAYIDGDHEAPSVMLDLLLVAERVRSGGYLCCHDYGRDSLPGVYKAVSEYMQNGKWDFIRQAGSMGAWRRK